MVYKYFLMSIAILTLFALTLYIMCQVPICKCGYVKLWHGVTYSPENSQHLSDWYSFSHVIHGFAFYFLLWKFGRNLPLGARFIIALLLELSLIHI